MRDLPEIKTTAAVMDKLLNMVRMTRKKPVAKAQASTLPVKRPVYQQMELPLL
jgi:hypothetical protein